MKERSYLVLFDEQATSSTTAYPSGWMGPSPQGVFSFHFYASGTGTGSLAFQTSDVDEETFKAESWRLRTGLSTIWWMSRV